MPGSGPLTEGPVPASAPAASRLFVLPVATRRWVLTDNRTEAVPLKNMTHREVIECITEHIIHRFGIPQTLTMDQGSSFISKEVRDFAELYKIKILNSSPYYA